MKRKIALLLCACLLLSGCHKKLAEHTVPTSASDTAATEVTGTPAPETTAAATTVPETTVPEATVPETTVPETTLPARSSSVIALSMPDKHDYEYAEDGTLLCIHNYQAVSFIHPDKAVAQKVTLDLLNQIDESMYIAEETKKSALNDYSGPEGWINYAHSSMYETMRLDSAVLSLRCWNSQYLGGPAAGGVWVFSDNYDLATGNRLTFSDIVTDEFSAPAMADLVIETLRGTDEYLYDNFENSVRNIFENGGEELEKWYFTPEGFCMFFGDHRIGFGIDGQTKAVIPYEKLTGLLKDQYFPSERPAGELSHSYTSFDGSDLQKYDTFAEMITDPEADKNLLTTDGLIFDVRIESGMFYEFDGEKSFSGSCTVFAASHLTENDAVMVQASRREESSAMRLTYSDGSETFSGFLDLPVKE